MKAVIYLRVSTEKQRESGLGLDAQLHACTEWAAREGVPVAGHFADDLGGATPLDKRPGLIDALAALEPGGALVVAKRDRLGRDVLVVAIIERTVEKKGCRVVSAAGEGTEGDADDPSAAMMRGMVDLFAQYERMVIKMRTAAALAAKRRRGELTGQVPYGMTVVDDGRRSKRSDRPAGLAVDRAEAEVLAEARRLRGLGWSFRRIAAELDARGASPKSGGAKWCHTSVRSMIVGPKPKQKGKRPCPSPPPGPDPKAGPTPGPSATSATRSGPSSRPGAPTPTPSPSSRRSTPPSSTGS